MTEPTSSDAQSRVDAVRSRLRRGRPRKPWQVAAGVAVVGLALTLLSTWATARVDYHTEKRLLQTQTDQAAAVLSSAIVVIAAPLSSALDVQQATGGDRQAFRRSMAPYVGDGRTFVSATLWRLNPSGSLRQVARIGVRPALADEPIAQDGELRRAFTEETFTVGGLDLPDGGSRIVFLQASERSGYAVHAERAVPADRRTPSDRDSAFADLHYATYLGTEISSEALTTTDLPASELPITGTSYRTEIPFGDTQLTLVATPRRHLGGDFGQRLPVVLLFVGLLLTGLASRLIYQVTRSRRAVEADAVTIASLYQRVDTLYGEQRDVSERLQRALLPPSNPAIPHFEVASEYIAGAQGVEIGGDWYSIVRLDEDRFAFVVGDVSGRGVDAVAVMARARFTLRAYLVDGHGPDVALEKASPQFDITADGHFTTVVVGTGRASTGQITLANAGHPPPLVLTAEGTAELLEVPAGPPLGVGRADYRTASFTLAPGSTLLAYTDGLVERRGEDIDVSLERLRGTAERVEYPSPYGFVAAVLAAMQHEGEDDIAVLALRRAKAATESV